MGKKFKPRQQKKARSLITLDMIVNAKGGPMRDRRERKLKERESIRHILDDEGYDPRCDREW
jgi:hypothetical protein